MLQDPSLDAPRGEEPEQNEDLFEDDLDVFERDPVVDAGDPDDLTDSDSDDSIHHIMPRVRAYIDDLFVDVDTDSDHDVEMLDSDLDISVDSGDETDDNQMVIQ